jgi:hypothetical protein
LRNNPLCPAELPHGSSADSRRATLPKATQHAVGPGKPAAASPLRARRRFAASASSRSPERYRALRQPNGPSFAAGGRGEHRLRALPRRGGAPQRCSKQCWAPPALLTRPHAQAGVARAAVRREHRRGIPTPPALPQPRLTYARRSLGTAGCRRATKARGVWSSAHTLAAIHPTELADASATLWTAMVCATCWPRSPSLAPLTRGEAWGRPEENAE